MTELEKFENLERTLYCVYDEIYDELEKHNKISNELNLKISIDNEEFEFKMNADLYETILSFAKEMISMEKELRS